MNASDVIDGRYRLERLLGTGGMAEVWLAEDQRLRRWVAVKVLHEQFSGTGSELVAAFEREATVIARMQHQNIVGVYDAGSHDGRRYIVMEYVHGYSLRQLLETQGRMTEAEAIRYGVQIASALHYAHGQGVVHCDIKPENVLINEAGVAKVADFGVAETLTRTMAPGQAQDLLGTIAYLAPEIIEGSDPSPSSDIYSLGLTLFELVAGRTPFSGASAGAALGQRLATPAPPLRTFARGASIELESTLARALALSPVDRYPNAAVFGAALQRVPRTSGTPVAPIAAPPGRPPQVPRRHDTARVVRAPAPSRDGPGMAAVMLAVGLVGAAIVVGVAAALWLSRDGGDDGGTIVPSPTPTLTAQPVTKTPQPSPTGTPTASPSPTRTVQPTATPTPPQVATATRTPTKTPAASATSTATAPAPTQTLSPTTAPTATATP
ncbi:protein kinase [Candidatus Amarobacter glycogenicus]|uniref:serine/threonine-protein kinase n=1 Tax=Candidatus Amarobacter glycogenicus TaxID=3140699 RepID=UPI002A164842|nr:protein kinase [Dehalococcoidia bacterium]